MQSSDNPTDFSYLPCGFLIIFERRSVALGVEFNPGYSCTVHFDVSISNALLFSSRCLHPPYLSCSPSLSWLVICSLYRPGL